MKVLGTDSFILKKVQFGQVWIFLYHCAAGSGVQVSSPMDYQKNCLVLNIFIIKKAAVILDFCLFGNIRRNFLVPRIIESAPKTFMPIQIPDLHRVLGIRQK